MNNILITGVAGFIGHAVAKKAIASGYNVIGIDNLNDYYSVALKQDRLKDIGNKNFQFYQCDISNQSEISKISTNHPDIEYIVHLAAQAGVRYSVENPFAYVQSNLVGHMVILEMCRQLKQLKHLVYASSSSVYGNNTKLPFAISDNVDHPVSLYAATKKADELLTHSYSHLYSIAATGLRFFTVYGPWGRPDMATFMFTKNIIEGKPIKVFNNGEMMRDFTYIDDIINGIMAAVKKIPANIPAYKIYNIGNHKAENLSHFIKILENIIGKKAIIEYAPMHPGDVKQTYADITETTNDLGFKPETSIEAGLPRFVDWYTQYYK